jgi:uncharacterized protein (TIGR02444 family)
MPEALPEFPTKSPMTTELVSPPQWNYALQMYGRPGVAEACLQLQSFCDVDVVVMLHAMYAFGVLRIRLDATTIAAADASVCAWREQVIRPLRVLRTSLQAGFAGLPSSAVESARQRIKSAELDAEAAAFAALAPFTQGAAVRSDDVAQADALLSSVIAFYAGDRSGDRQEGPSEASLATLSRELCTGEASPQI